jgi:hypothetical protein
MNQKRIFFAVLIIFLLFPAGIWAQDAAPQDAPPQGGAGTAELPRQFRQLALGMNIDDLKENLIKDELFNFRGDRDVSFLPVRDQSLVETTGSSFIRRAFFQIRDGSVFIMAFALNTAIIDHFSVFTQFTEKYGEPSYLDPRLAIWETEQTRIAIERPLTVKYIDKVVFDGIVNESGLIQSGQVRMRQEFLNEF